MGVFVRIVCVLSLERLSLELDVEVDDGAVVVLEGAISTEKLY